VSSRTLPRITAETAPYWEACKRGELCLQSCDACGHLQFYPRALCSACLGLELSWRVASGRGSIASFSVVRRAVSSAYADETPYTIVLVDLAEGPRMMSSLVDDQPQSVRIGLPVSVVFDVWSDDITMPRFRIVAQRGNSGAAGDVI
jgi:uncharacterized OB-fold protein